MWQKALWFLDLLMQKKEKKEHAHDIGKIPILMQNWTAVIQMISNTHLLNSEVE